jgi:glycosyltransferase involved in cell wall biosynthesis
MPVKTRKIQMPLVSITSACYNIGSEALDMIRSVLAQTYQEWELVVLDDGSSDNTYEVLSSVEDPRIRVYRNDTNQGIPASLNRITQLCRGSYIARMDCDDLASPSRIQKQVEFLEANPKVDVVGTGMIYLDSDNHPLGRGNVVTAHEEICRCPQRGIGLAHPTILGRKAWFEKFRYNQAIARTSDYNLFLRAHQQSVYANLPEYLFYYRLGASFNLRKEFKSRHCLWKSVADYYLPRKRYGLVLKSLAVTYLKYLYEVAMVQFVSPQRAFAHRYLKLDPHQQENAIREIQSILSFPLRQKTASR